MAVFSPQPTATETGVGTEAVAERNPQSKVAEELDAPAPKPSFLARLKRWLTFRNKPIETEVEPDAETTADRKPRTQTAEEPEVPSPSQASSHD